MRAHNYFLFALVACFSVGVMPSLEAKKIGLLERIVFSDKGYADAIETQGWVITETQLQEVFAHQQDPEQLTFEHLSGSRLYYLLRLKNRPALRADGALRIHSEMGELTFDVIDVEPCLEEPVYYVLSIGKCNIPPSMYEKQPTVSFRWTQLYVK